MTKCDLCKKEVDKVKRIKIDFVDKWYCERCYKLMINQINMMR